MNSIDFPSAERSDLKRFLVWHIGYLIYISLFFFVIFHFGLFKSFWLLEEAWIANLVAPIHTLFFILLGPFRRDWFMATKNTYQALDGETILLVMAGLILALGFYLYSLLIWVLGAFIPVIIYSS